MADKIKIVGIGGSMGMPSSSLAALMLALEGAEQAGAETKLFDVRAMNLPLYVPGTKDIPEAAHQLCDSVCEAQGLIWSSPLYHGTISGAFKNALDWLDLLRNSTPPFLTDKMVGLIGTAGGVQGLQAVNTMEFVVRAMRGWAVPLVMPIPRAGQAFDAAGRPTEPGIAEQLQTLGLEVVRAARQFGIEGSCDYSRPENQD